MGCLFSIYALWAGGGCSHANIEYIKANQAKYLLTFRVMSPEYCGELG